MKIKALIVDDERLARQRLRRLLGALPEIEIVGDCADGSSAVDAARELKPDLMLLDIQMPGMDGFDVVEALGMRPLPIIIFVTAFDKHALRAFEACALDYLLKPVSPERLEKAIARVITYVASFRTEPTPAAEETEEPVSRRFHVRSGQRTSFVTPEEIDWIEADGNYAILHVGTQNHLLRATMSSLEADLPKTFMRMSRSAIVNLRSVRELQASAGSHLALMKDDVQVPVTVGVRNVQQRLRSL